MLNFTRTENCYGGNRILVWQKTDQPVCWIFGFLFVWVSFFSSLFSIWNQIFPPFIFTLLSKFFFILVFWVLNSFYRLFYRCFIFDNHHAINSYICWVNVRHYICYTFFCWFWCCSCNCVINEWKMRMGMYNIFLFLINVIVKWLLYEQIIFHVNSKDFFAVMYILKIWYNVIRSFRSHLMFRKNENFIL